MLLRQHNLDWCDVMKSIWQICKLNNCNPKYPILIDWWKNQWSEYRADFMELIYELSSVNYYIGSTGNFKYIISASSLTDLRKFLSTLLYKEIISWGIFFKITLENIFETAYKKTFWLIFIYLQRFDTFNMVIIR